MGTRDQERLRRGVVKEPPAGPPHKGLCPSTVGSTDAVSTQTWCPASAPQPTGPGPGQITETLWGPVFSVHLCPPRAGALLKAHSPPCPASYRSHSWVTGTMGHHPKHKTDPTRTGAAVQHPAEGLLSHPRTVEIRLRTLQGPGRTPPCPALTAGLWFLSARLLGCLDL